MRNLAAADQRSSLLEARVANQHRDGLVAEVNPADGLCRLRLGGTDERPVLSPWVRYEQVAGKLKVHSPPTVGQQMRLTSPGGDWRLGVARPYGWTDDNPSPGVGPDPVLTFGDQVRVEIKDDRIAATVGDASVVIASDGFTFTIGSTVLTLVDGKATIKAELIETDGETRLDKGTREVVFKGSVDTRGDTNNQGAARVKV